MEKTMERAMGIFSNHTKPTEKKKWLITRVLGSPTDATIKAGGFGLVRENAGLIRELASRLDPRRYPWSKRAEWSNPEKAAADFKQTMRVNRISENEIRRRHRSAAITVYLMTLLQGAAIAFGLSTALFGGSPVNGILTAAAGIVLTSGAFFRFSLQSMQLRDRNLGVGFRQWFGRKWEWIPPLDSPLIERKPKRRSAAGQTGNGDRPEGN